MHCEIVTILTDVWRLFLFQYISISDFIDPGKFQKKCIKARCHCVRRQKKNKNKKKGKIKWT